MKKIPATVEPAMTPKAFSEMVDKLKEQHGILSDSKFARIMGISGSHFSTLKSGRCPVTEECKAKLVDAINSLNALSKIDGIHQQTEIPSQQADNVKSEAKVKVSAPSITVSGKTSKPVSSGKKITARMVAKPKQLTMKEAVANLCKASGRLQEINRQLVGSEDLGSLAVGVATSIDEIDQALDATMDSI